MKSVEDLDVFKLAHQLALKTYSTTKVFPRKETFSLVDQMRRVEGIGAWHNNLYNLVIGEYLKTRLSSSSGGGKSDIAIMTSYHFPSR